MAAPSALSLPGQARRRCLEVCDANQIAWPGLPAQNLGEMHLTAAIAERKRDEHEEAQARAARVIRQAQLRALAGEAVLYLEASARQARIKWDKSNWQPLLQVIEQGRIQFGSESISAALAFVRMPMSNPVADEIRARYNVPAL